MLPVWLRKLIEGGETFPVPLETLGGIRLPTLLTPAHKLRPPPFGLSVGCRIGNLTEEGFGGHLLSRRQFIEHIEYLVVPAALLLYVGIHIPQPRPNPQMAIAQHQPRRA
jgi:hypothetical protein